MRPVSIALSVLLAGGVALAQQPVRVTIATDPIPADVNMLVNAQDTNSITVKCDRAGVFWYYCPWFCHALHLEMRGRLIVEPVEAPAEEAPAEQ